MRFQIVTLVLAVMMSLGAVLPLTGCSMPEVGVGGALKGGPTVLSVNGQTITKNEYQETLDFYSKLMKVNNSAEAQANPVVDEVLKQMTLNQLILTALVEQEAQEQKITVLPNELEEQIKKQTELAGGAGAMKRLLKEQNMSQEDFKKSIQKQLLMNKVIDAQAGDKVAVSDKEARAYYTENKEQFTMPYSIRASHILVKSMVPEIRNEIQEENPDISSEALQKQIDERLAANKSKAEDLYEQVKKNPDKFKQLAEAESDDKLSAMNEGDLGFLTERYTDPAFWQAAKTTKEGSLHEGVVKSPFGYHVLIVHEKREPYKQSFEEAKDAIVNVLGQEKRQKFMSEWLEEKQKEVAIDIEPDYQPKSMEELNPQAAKAPQAATKEGQPSAKPEAPAAQQAG